MEQPECPQPAYILIVNSKLLFVSRYSAYLSRQNHNKHALHHVSANVLELLV